MSEGLDFNIPVHPIRSYDSDTITTRGGTVFSLVPETDQVDIPDTVDQVLESSTYVVGDWFELPRPVYLVRDAERGTIFRVVVADESVDIHVLPSTTADGIAAFYNGLCEESDQPWTVEKFVERP